MEWGRPLKLDYVSRWKYNALLYNRAFKFGYMTFIHREKKKGGRWFNELRLEIYHVLGFK